MILFQLVQFMRVFAIQKLVIRALLDNLVHYVLGKVLQFFSSENFIFTAEIWHMASYDFRLSVTRRNVCWDVRVEHFVLGGWSRWDSQVDEFLLKIQSRFITLDSWSLSSGFLSWERTWRLFLLQAFLKKVPIEMHVFSHYLKKLNLLWFSQVSVILTLVVIV